MFYVTMIDKFMSGWGPAKKKKNVLVFECETAEEAEIVAENGDNREEMRHVNIRKTKPYYGDGYLVNWKDKTCAGRWYEKGAFR